VHPHGRLTSAVANAAVSRSAVLKDLLDRVEWSDAGRAGRAMTSHAS
jgi:hypothetical protein